MSRRRQHRRVHSGRRRRPNAIVNIGYVGRLSVGEERAPACRQLEAELDAEGLDVRFTIVGEGSEREWLRRHMLRAEFTGVLRGEALADAYAQMDIFAFPSETDTVGNARARSDGVGRAGGRRWPAVGQRFIVEAGQTAHRRGRSRRVHSGRAHARQESRAQGSDGRGGARSRQGASVLGSHVPRSLPRVRRGDFSRGRRRAQSMRPVTGLIVLVAATVTDARRRMASRRRAVPTFEWLFCQPPKRMFTSLSSPPHVPAPKTRANLRIPGRPT